MATTDNVSVSTSTGANGTTYTSAISNDKLTNQDFLKLMLEELKMQDPTKPMDSQSMLNSQMQMSSIETNLALVNAMNAMQTAFTQSNLSNASNLIGTVVEDGTYNSSKALKQYSVQSVALNNGAVELKAYEITGYDSATKAYILATTPTTLALNKVTSIHG